jgi:hypothetical protein
MGFKIRLVLLIVILTVPTSVWAIHPFQVEETTTRGKGNFLFELNDDYSKDDSNRSTELTGILTGGLSENIDLAVDVPYLKLDPRPGTNALSSGMGDAQIRFKQRLFENEVKQSMAYEFYVTLPTGDLDKGLGTNDIYWGVKLMDQQVCHGNILHASLAYEVSGRDMKNWHFADNYAFLFGLAAEHKITEKFWLLTELAGESRKTIDRETGTGVASSPFTFMAGFKYDIFRSWYVDLAGRAGLNKYADDYSVLAGTAWRF